MSNELVGNSFYDNIDNPMEAMEKIGSYLVKSGMFGCSKVEQGAVLAMACMCEKKNPLEIARTYHIVEGKLSKKYEAMIAEFFAMGGKIDWLQRTDEVVEGKFTHPHNGSYTLKITLDDMKKSGVALMSNGKMKNTYQAYPRQMLTARVVSEVMRLIAPSVVCGVYTPEEISDFSDSGPVAKPQGKSMPVKEEVKPEPVVEIIADAVVEEVIEKPKTRKPRATQAEMAERKKKAEADKASAGAVLSSMKEDRIAELEDQKANEVVDPETAKEQKIISIESRLNPIATEANAYLKNLGWINDGQTYLDLSDEHMDMLKDRLDTFIAKVTEIKDAK